MRTQYRASPCVGTGKAGPVRAEGTRMRTHLRGRPNRDARDAGETHLALAKSRKGTTLADSCRGVDGNLCSEECRCSRRRLQRLCPAPASSPVEVRRVRTHVLAGVLVLASRSRLERPCGELRDSNRCATFPKANRRNASVSCVVCAMSSDECIPRIVR